MTRRGATKGAVAIGAIGAALYVAARTTGAGWLVVILCGLIAVLAISVVWPVLALRRVRLDVTAPSDATAGTPIAVEIAATRAGAGVRILPLAPAGDMAAVVGDGATQAEVVADRRGVVTACELEIASAAPFGFVWWRRRLSVALTRPIAVAPRRPIETRELPVGGAPDGDAMGGRTAHGDQIRSVRDYAPGDPLRLVHWPATARQGHVMVKERELPHRPRLVLAVDVTGSSEQADAVAEQAMGVICDALDAGREVTLATVERDGPRTAVVASTRDGGRRLAYAVAGRPEPPAGTDLTVLSTRTLASS